MIHYRVGDATDISERPAIIAHICNDMGRWGRGFVLALSARWTEPEAYYRGWYAERRDHKFALGELQLVPVEEDLWVANMVAQHDIRAHGSRPPFRADALRDCLIELSKRAVAHRAAVHMPRIGTGLAGGTWEEIEPLIERHLIDVGIEVYVYLQPPLDGFDQLRVIADETRPPRVPDDVLQAAWEQFRRGIS